MKSKENKKLFSYYLISKPINRFTQKIKLLLAMRSVSNTFNFKTEKSSEP